MGSGKVAPEDLKVEAIKLFPTPRTKKHIQSFLGIARYYRKLIPQFASLATPLTDLTQKLAPNKVVWAPDCDWGFQSLKSALCSAPILRSPDLTKQFVPKTDTSDRGVGTVLSQCDKQGQDRPVVSFSRKNYGIQSLSLFVCFCSKLLLLTN